MDEILNPAANSSAATGPRFNLGSEQWRYFSVTCYKQSDGTVVPNKVYDHIVINEQGDPVVVVGAGQSDGSLVSKKVNDHVVTNERVERVVVQEKDTVRVPINSWETSLFRVINSALNQQLFFTIANHILTVIGAGTSYVKPFTTNVLMHRPGKITDVLIKADQVCSSSSVYAQAKRWDDARSTCSSKSSSLYPFAWQNDWFGWCR